MVILIYYISENEVQYIAATIITNFNTHANLVYMSPVLAMVIQALPHHAHDFWEGHNIVG